MQLILVWALGAMSKNMDNRLEELDIQGGIKTVQRISITILRIIVKNC